MTPELLALLHRARAAYRAGDRATLSTVANDFIGRVLEIHDLTLRPEEMRAVGGLDHFAGNYPHVRLNLASWCTLCTPRT